MSPADVPAPRRTRIGGSEIGAVLGCDPWKDAHALWLFKRGLVERIPPNMRMRMGTACESVILEEYAAVSGRPIRPGGAMVHHLTIPFMVYSPDALCLHESRGVDAKLVNPDQKYKWGSTADEIPEHIQLQCHWYMAAMDYPVWDVAACLTSGELMIYTVERDLALEEEILKRAEEYWQRYLIGDEIPPIGVSPESERFLKERFPRNKKPLRVATNDEIVLLERFGDLKIELNKVDEQFGIVSNQLKLAVGDAEGLEWLRGRFTWKATKDSMETDWERLAQSLLKNYGTEERAAFVHEFTETKPGYRRIYYRREGGSL
jgi:predicted phage-related endonuclease